MWRQQEENKWKYFLFGINTQQKQQQQLMVIVSIVGVRIVYTTLIYRQTNRRNSVGGQIESDKDALA